MYSVDASHAMGVQIGEDNTQIIYAYGNLTWTDGVAPPPLVSVSGRVDSPYRGLSAFEERDAPFFFGREAAAAQILDRMSECLAATGLLVLSGASGAGKSSLLRAGVLPRLRGDGLAAAPGAVSWPCLLFTPGRAPLDALAVRVASLAGADAAAVRRALDADPAGFALTARQAALAPPGGLAGGSSRPLPGQREQLQRLLLVVDQFEQLFTQCSDEAERQAFITALHAAAARDALDQPLSALVVLGVRADFEARCADYPQLADAVQERYLLTSMTERQLRMAITEPARKAGSRVDHDLIDVLLREVSTRQPASPPAVPGRGPLSGAGVLPLLSHALDQAWRSRTGDVLTLADYERTGGIEAAVASSAQRAYDGLTPAQQAVARQVFIRLTATSSDGVDTASRAGRAELTEGRDPAGVRDVEAVLEAFAAERLITLAAGTVEVSHEVLLTAWPLLRDTWLAETHADRIVRTRLHGTAGDWARDSCDPSYLYSGSLLEAAAGAAARIGADPARHVPLSRTERDFLRASHRASRRRRHRRQGTIAFLLALVVGMATATALAVHATRVSSLQRDMAISQEIASEAAGLDGSEPNLAKQLSVAAYQIAQTPAAFSGLFASQALPGIITAAGVTDAAFGNHGRLLALVAGQQVRLWSMARHAVLAIIPAATGATCVAFIGTEDGNLLAVGDTYGAVELWNVAHPLRPVLKAVTAGEPGPVEQAAFSPDGNLLASAGWDHTVRVWDITTPSHPRRVAILSAGASAASSIAFRPDGRLLAAADWDQSIRLWDISNAHDPVLLDKIADKQVVRSVAFSPDGHLLATGGGDQTVNAGGVHLWNVTDPYRPRQLAALSTGVTAAAAVAFSPTAPLLMATGTSPYKTFLWDISYPADPFGLPSLGGGGLCLAFSPDGQTLATIGQSASSTSGSDDEIQIWDVADSQYPAVWAVIPSEGFGLPGTADMDASGRLLAVTSGQSVQLWNIATAPHTTVLAVLADLPGLPSTTAFAFQGRRTLLATGGDGWVTLWDVTVPSRPSRLAQIHIGRPRDAEPEIVVAFSPDGRILAALGTGDGVIRLWSLRNPRGVVPLPDLAGAPAGSLSFGPGGGRRSPTHPGLRLLREPSYGTYRTRGVLRGSAICHRR